MAIMKRMSKQPNLPLANKGSLVNCSIQPQFKGRFLICHRQATLVSDFGSAKTLKVYYGKYETDGHLSWQPTMFSRN